MSIDGRIQRISQGGIPGPNIAGQAAYGQNEYDQQKMHMNGRDKTVSSGQGIQNRDYQKIEYSEQL